MGHQVADTKPILVLLYKSEINFVEKRRVRRVCKRVGWDSQVVTQGVMKISSHCAFEWSDGPENGIVVPGAPCAFRKSIAFSQNLVGC